LHVWREEWADDLSWLEELDQLKREGKIRAIGISINDHEPVAALAIVKQGVIDVMQVIYNIFDQTPNQNLFPLCQELGTGVIVRCPFDEGSLTGMITPQTSFPDDDWRNRYFRDNRKELVAEHLKPLNTLLGQEASTLAELSLRFCLSHPAVTTVIPGMRRVSHVLANTQVSDGQLLSDGLLRTLENQTWKKNFYQ
jgi:aryl-alcohol dehydrogenase-like predicted oxidoreductase